MSQKFFVTLEKIVNEFKWEIIYSPVELNKIQIYSSDINRPSLQLAGEFDYFDTERLQVLGMVEFTYLSKMTSDERYKRINAVLKRNIPAVIVSRNQEIFPELLKAAEENAKPILRSKDSTSALMSYLIAYLNVALAPRITTHGVLVEVYGEGVLIIGESGVGKSETAVELVKRGHRLVADDAVEIKRVSDRTLVATSPEIIRYFIELRGIGIIDVRKIFGMGAIKESEKIDLVINLELWDEKKQYERLGMNDTTTEILGIEIPSLVIPVRPGRNLAIVVEVASMNNRQKRLGYNAAQDLNDRLFKQMEEQE